MVDDFTIRRTFSAYLPSLTCLDRYRNSTCMVPMSARYALDAAMPVTRSGAYSPWAEIAVWLRGKPVGVSNAPLNLHGTHTSAVSTKQLSVRATQYTEGTGTSDAVRV